MRLTDSVPPATPSGSLSRVLSKASWRLLPLIGLAYCLSYVDRVNISFAEPTMSKALGLSASVYGQGAGIFFLSYAAAALPSNLLLTRLGPRLWLGAMMCAWGLTAAAMTLVRTPTAFLALRFLLGATEGGFFPGVIYTLTLWFPAAFRGRAVSRFYIAAPLATLVMGAAAGALLKLDGTAGLAGWQWLLLVEGVPSTLAGVALLALLPDSPARAPWLAEAEKALIAGALAKDAVERPGRVAGAVSGALRDGAIWAMGAANFLVLGCSYAIIYFGPRLLQEGVPVTPGQSGAIVAASGLIGVATMLGAAASSDRRGERFGHLAGCWLVAAAGAALTAFTPSGWPLAAGYLLFFAGHFGAQGVFWASIDRLLSPAQAAAGIAIISTVGMCGSYLGPTLLGMIKDATGNFRLGLDAVPAGFVLAAAIALGLRFAARRRAGRG
ncbi:MAG TPA: MFS transporter [Caulobacteraceae bacterium]|jgi:ACS family tartrate transporter-like MFS transporter|nr:MFS transporter [Caulobacteraceae bacterium]